MDYDFHGNWDKVTGHIAPLYNTPGDDPDYYDADSSIKHWIKSGATRDKLLMGIPLYGQSFTLASASEHGLKAPTYGPGEAGTYTRQGGVLAFYEICTKNWNVVQDPAGRMGPYGYSGTQWVSYDDIPMVTKKANYIKDQALAGGMIWALDMDDFTNQCKMGRYPLLTAIANTLKN
jgi:chitinase